MIIDEKFLSRILRIFGYFLLTWKLLAAVGFSIAGPIFIHMRLREHPEYANDWMTVEVIVLIYLIGALAGYLIIKKYMTAAIVFLLIGGSILYAHYFYINKADVIGLLVAYWELIVLLPILWQLRKDHENTTAA